MCTGDRLQLFLLFPNFREIQQSLRSAKGLHAQWAKLLDSGADPGRVENAQSELNKALKSIEWDLQDLDQTISISSLCQCNHRTLVAWWDRANVFSGVVAVMIVCRWLANTPFKTCLS